VSDGELDRYADYDVMDLYPGRQEGVVDYVEPRTPLQVFTEEACRESQESFTGGFGRRLFHRLLAGVATVARGLAPEPDAFTKELTRTIERLEGSLPALRRHVKHAGRSPLDVFANEVWDD
jgi:hypothetical protein